MARPRHPGDLPARRGHRHYSVAGRNPSAQPEIQSCTSARHEIFRHASILPAIRPPLRYHDTMSRSDWARKIDWSQALVNVKNDIKGDWYRDPWNWPEYDYVFDGNIDIVLERAAGSGIKRPAKIDVPKYNFATRPAVVLEPLDRLAFQGLTDFVSPKIVGKLDDWVYGWRLPRKDAKPGQYSKNGDEWDRYFGHLQRLVSVSTIGLRTDIVSCFASIPVDRVCEDIQRAAGRNAVTNRLADMLRIYDQVPGRSGIPQRSFASCLVATMYLSRLDPILQAYSESRSRGRLAFWAKLAGGGPFVTRWMDDIWAFGSDEGKLRALQFDLQNEAREIGLELHASKTEVLSGDDLAAAALRLEHSAVDEALREETPDTEPLESLIDKILEDPINADRSSLRFAMTRMRRNNVTSRLPALVEAAHRMPQGADHLARAFRDFKLWEDLQDWYIEYEASDWAKMTWSVSQLGTMFPTKGVSSHELKDRFLELLSARPPLPMLALTAQRLASWSPDNARDCLRELAGVADHPLERRLIAIASLAVGEDTVRVRRLLSEYEENRVTLAAIEAREFRPFDTAPDFSAD